MTELIICAHCGQHHPISDIELSFRRPDDYLSVPLDEREQRTQASDDLCAIWGDNDDGHRYFVKGLLPLYVEAWAESYAIGVWVEVSRPAFDRVLELWDDAAQAQEPPFPARLANALPFHAATGGLQGSLYLTGPDARPEFQLAPSEHALFREQENGISPHRAYEYSASASASA